MVILLVLLSILAFWMSTQQSSLLVRLPIWIAGAGLLLIAAYLAFQAGGHDAVFAAVTDAWKNKDHPSESVLAQAVQSNAPVVQRYVTPLRDMMIVFGAILGAFALLALTPGEFLERAFVRPLSIGIFGATVGASLALAIVAASIGGPVKLHRLVGYGDPAIPAQVHDGDTFWLGDVSARLLDIDAPEQHQLCRAGTAVPTDCGEEGQKHLAELIREKVVVCDVKTNADGKNQESFGRPLVTCKAHNADGTGFDLNQAMVRDGYAAAYLYGDGTLSRFATDAAEARDQKRGILRLCTLQPKIWRTDPAAREAFKKDGTIPADPAKSIGDCGAQPRAPA